MASFTATRRQMLSGAVGLSLASVVDAATLLGRGQDLLLYNANIRTMDARQPVAQAAVVRSGRIIFVGDNVRAKEIGKAMPKFDAGGRTVVPGFVDTHTHVELVSESLAYQPTVPRELRTLEEMYAILRTRIAQTPKGQWVLGRGYFNIETQVAEKRMPTREEMDALSTDHPVILLASVHVASLNTMAFKKLGLWTEQDQKSLKWADGSPRTGSQVDRDAHGLPTGIATEIFDLIFGQDMYSTEEIISAVRTHAQRDFVSKGITSVTNIPFNVKHLHAQQFLHKEGSLNLRMRNYYVVPAITSVHALATTGFNPGAGDDMFCFGGVKVFVDGAGTDGHGHRIEDYKWTQDELNDVVHQCNLAGFPMIQHVVSPGGLKMALTAHRESQRRQPSSLRHRIDHIGFLSDPASITEMKSLRQTAGITRAAKGSGQPARSPDFRTMLDLGLDTVLVTDSAGSFSLFSPLAGIASLVAPVNEGGILPDGKRLTIDEAWPMYTTQAARSVYEEDEKGSITIGKLGDFSVLTADPWKVQGGNLFEIGIEVVILGGKPVFQA